MAMIERVDLDQLPGPRIGLRQPAAVRVAAQHRNVGVEHAGRRVIVRALEAFGGVVDRNLRQDLMPWIGGDEAQESRLVVRIGDDDHMVLGIIGHRIGALAAAGRNRVGDLSAPGLDHLDGAVPIAHPELGASVDADDAIGPGGRAAIDGAREAGDVPDECVGPGIDDVDRLVVLVGQIAEPGVLVDIHDADGIDRPARMAMPATCFSPCV